MDEPSPRVYEAGGRKPGDFIGYARREAERCVSRPSARPRNRFSGGLEQGRTLAMASVDSLKTHRELTAGGKTYHYYSLRAAEEAGLAGISRLPVSLKVLLENQLRFEDGVSVGEDDLKAFAAWVDNKGATEHEVSFRPARVLMQDFTGVPAVVDLAAMRDALAKLGADAAKINPLVPVDLVIDHSVMVDYFGAPSAFGRNVEKEYERNLERYRFLRWGSSAFNNFRVVPPGTGICHQVNLEYLAQTVWSAGVGDDEFAYPDTVVGTDSHTTMVNGLSVLGWGVGGIEAEAAMLGQPIPMLIPEVIGFKLTGALPEGATATDMVLTVTQMLRKKGVVGKFVEYFGDGLSTLTIEDQATIANMAPEYGATCGFFPVTQSTLDYLTRTGRAKERVALVEAYAKEQGLWSEPGHPEPVFSDVLELDLATVAPSLAGPKRPQDRVALADAAAAFKGALGAEFGKHEDDFGHRVPVAGEDHDIGHGDVVIAAITSCTNTSNPGVLLAAGLLAKNAVAKGLKTKPWVKTSLAPGSQVVTDYLDKAGLTKPLNALGFDLVGYGCTTCIGNSGPLAEPVSKAIADGDLVAVSVLSGNRNFEGRVNPDTRANYLASPPLVVAYALAGSMSIDLDNEPLGLGKGGKPVFLKDIWPTTKDIHALQKKVVGEAMFAARYGDVFKGDKHWQGIEVAGGQTYAWDMGSTYVQNPPYFEGLTMTPDPVTDIIEARILGIFGDSITTDHISPAGNIRKTSPAGEYLSQHQVSQADFNSYGARRGNHEVMMRGTFANIRIRNKITPDIEGGVTKHFPSGEVMSIYDAAMRYKAEGRPAVIIAGKEYGTGSSRDWAAKGTKLLGVRAVIAETFERIHRSNLVGMGVLPLQFIHDGWQRMGLTGEEIVSIRDLEDVAPRKQLMVEIYRPSDGKIARFPVRCRIDTPTELEYFHQGGVLNYVLRNLAKAH
jgi:aconitate hydratase